jgi:hypothetical protein
LVAVAVVITHKLVTTVVLAVAVQTVSVVLVH